MSSRTSWGGKREDDYLIPPHGGRPPSDEAVKKATRRYVLAAWCAGFRPSVEWAWANAIQSRGAALIAADKENIYWTKGELP